MNTRLLSEEELDLADHARPTDPSADINLGSHLPNPLFPSSNVPNLSDKSPIKKVPSSPSIGGSPKKGMVTTSMATPDSHSKRDRINNVTQKEEAMALAGVNRISTYKVIVRLLSAQRKVSVTDVQGNVTEEWVPDLSAQARGAELALKAFGDMIEHKSVEYGIADSTLEKLKSLSVAALRERASLLLEGRTKAVDVAAGISEAEVVS